MENISFLIYALFILTVLLVFTYIIKILQNKSIKNNSKRIVLGTLLILTWLIFTGILSEIGFYREFNSFPPRFIYLVLPPLVFILLFLIFSKKIQYEINLKSLVLIHILRVPVEIVLWQLFEEHLVPKEMTFHGSNFDILAGISAPIIAYLYFKKKSISKSVFLRWNIVCLGLLLNVVITAILSAPTTFQIIIPSIELKAIFYLPFIWLPGFLVPIVLFSHLVTIKRIIQNRI